MTVKKIQKSWRVHIHYAGKPYRRKSPENSKAGALAYEAMLRHKLARGEPLPFDKPDKRKEERQQKFKKFAWEWFRVYVLTHNKHSERHTKKYTLQTHLVPFFGETPIDKISSLQVERYQSRKLSAGLSKKSINNQLTILITCLKKAQDWFGLEQLPQVKKLKVPPPPTNFLTQEESERLVANSTGMWQDVIFTVIKTGLRRGELKALQWADIDWNNRILTVRHSWCIYKNGMVTPKGNRERHVPMTDELHTRLLKRRQATGFVFRDKDTQVFSNRRLNIEISKACNKAGIKRVTCHQLRHTFASHLVMAGAPLKAVQELLGHADIKTTMRYAHLSASSLKKAVNLLEPPEVTSSDPQHYSDTLENQLINISSPVKTLTPELALFKATGEH